MRSQQLDNKPLSESMKDFTLDNRLTVGVKF